jgi:radical SAM protein with 4Fe4S-binding SPASM domain
LTIDDMHLNVAQVSSHYYGNDSQAGVVPDPRQVRVELHDYRKLKGRPRSAAQLLEGTYLKYLDEFLLTGRTPMPCHALRASCFIDPWGIVYPCISYTRPIGRLRETGMRLDPIWNGGQAKELQAAIWEGQCPQCWTACEAYQSILGNVLAGRFSS